MNENDLIFMFDYLVPIWWNCLGRVRRCGCIRGGLVAGGVFEVSKPQAIPIALSLCLLLVDKDMLQPLGTTASLYHHRL